MVVKQFFCTIFISFRSGSQTRSSRNTKLIQLPMESSVKSSMESSMESSVDLPCPLSLELLALVTNACQQFTCIAIHPKFHFYSESQTKPFHAAFKFPPCFVCTLLKFGHQSIHLLQRKAILCLLSLLRIKILSPCTHCHTMLDLNENPPRCPPRPITTRWVRGSGKVQNKHFHPAVTWHLSSASQHSLEQDVAGIVLDRFPS